MCECSPKTNQSQIHMFQSQIHMFIETTKCISVVRKQTKAFRSIISRHTESVREVYENWFLINSYVFRKPQSVWVLSENNPKPSEASYLDTQNVWERSTKTHFSLIHLIFRKAQSVRVLSENNPKPSEASYVDRQNVWEGCTKIDFSSIMTFNIQFIEGPKVCECCPKTIPTTKRQIWDVIVL